MSLSDEERTCRRRPDMSDEIVPFGRCTQLVVTPGLRGFAHHRCTRKAISDSGFCFVHDPDYIKTKREKRHAKWVAEQRINMVQWYGSKFKDVLERIAQGEEGNPVEAAKRVLAKFERERLKIK